MNFGAFQKRNIIYVNSSYEGNGFELIMGLILGQCRCIPSIVFSVRSVEIVDKIMKYL
jgi:hypothetical protein